MYPLLLADHISTLLIVLYITKEVPYQPHFISTYFIKIQAK